MPHGMCLARKMRAVSVVVSMLLGACRLQRIKDIAGRSGQDDAALNALVEGDFDPDQYDKQMAAAFGDDYYEVQSQLV